MELPKFSTLSGRSDKAIPFKPNETSLIEWLKGFENKTEHYLICRQIYDALQALNAKEMEPKLRLTLLQHMRAAIIPIVKRLEQPLLRGLIPLASDGQANYEVIAATHASLAYGYWRAAKDISVLPYVEAFLHLLTDALFAGLEALKRFLLYTSAVYERPYKGFWHACYQFYLLADRYELQDKKLLKDTKWPVSVAGNFKSLLLFHLSGPNQFSPKDMKELLRFVEQYSDSAMICDTVVEKERPLFFNFSFEGDSPPAFSKQPGEGISGPYYLSTLKIAKIAYDAFSNQAGPWSAANMLKRPQLAIIVKNLGMGSHRKYIRVSVKKNHFGIVGYDKILDFLRKSATNGFTANVQPFDPRVAGVWQVPDLELLPLDDEESDGWKKLTDDTDARHMDFRLISDYRPDTPDLGWEAERFGEFKITDSNVKGYGILSQEKNLQAELGDFIGILNSDDGDKTRLEIGIIRRIGKHDNGVISFGVELMSYEAEAICIYREGNVLTKNWAVLLQGIKAMKQSDSIIYNSQAFSVGDEICLERGDHTERGIIKQLLCMAPAATHAELEYASEVR